MGGAEALHTIEVSKHALRESRLSGFLPTQAVYRQFRRILGPAIMIGLFAACSTSSAPPNHSPQQENSLTEAGAPTVSENGSSDAHLQDLANRRLVNKDADFPIGPGDVLQISVPGMEQLKDISARVSEANTISLPLLGEVPIGGDSEEQARNELRRRLKKFMYTPQVDLFVKEYHSRQVAVVGAVDKPGLYTLDRHSDTLLDLISRAGGIKDDAAQRVLLFPAETANDDLGAVRNVSAQSSSISSPDGQPIATASEDRLTKTMLFSKGQLNPLVANRDPIVIDLANLQQGGETTALHLPARPGDVIFVPHAGEVLVEGWVQKPGEYKITSGLTVLGAVAAAGGALFAADESSIRLVRSSKNGTKIFMTENLDKIRRGEAQDVTLQEGDVIDAPYSAVKMGPYAVYSILSRFYVGANAPLF
jgi:polysaccharide export outer membrane protein